MHSIRALSAIDHGEFCVLIFLEFYIKLKIWGL
jgi:hypothetical protein